MDPTKRLAYNLRAESAAYGYTLTIWGTGALSIDAFGMPDAVSVFAYIGGALLGFAALSFLAFDGPLSHMDDPDPDTELAAISMVHVVATAGNLALVLLVVNTFRAHGVPPAAAYGVAGLQSTVVYNAFLLLEEQLSEVVVSSAGA